MISEFLRKSKHPPFVSVPYAPNPIQVKRRIANTKSLTASQSLSHTLRPQRLTIGLNKCLAISPPPQNNVLGLYDKGTALWRLLWCAFIFSIIFRIYVFFCIINFICCCCCTFCLVMVHAMHATPPLPQIHKNNQNMQR